MEVQNHPDPDGQVRDEQPIAELTIAKPGHSYPIRMLHLRGGMLIIGYVINVFPDTILILRPHVIEVEFNPETETIEEYEFRPYLDQLVFYNPRDMAAIPFMTSAVISVTRPAEHLIENYTSIVRLKELVSVTPEDEHKDLIYKRSIPSTKTRH